jgi:predicted 3-demethylubiquinone-9 3-methyltransferase (glyoxalase superfamily)
LRREAVGVMSAGMTTSTSTTPQIVPCLWLDDDAEDAAQLYASVFPQTCIVGTSHYPTTVDNPGNMPRGSVLTVELEVAGARFTLLNGGPVFAINPSISFFVMLPTEKDVDRVFHALKEGGEALMDVDTYPWSKRYGWVKDRYGVSWQVMHDDKLAPCIMPCLMFSDAHHGQAEEAMRLYTTVLDGKIDSIDRYTKDQGPEGTVAHGRFTIRGQRMVAMDSHIQHNITFNEGVSLQVMCEDQAEIDRLWDRLSEGGEKGQCGWLKDRFGVSWQVVPANIASWLTSTDVKARDRAFDAMMKMKKPDVRALEAAFHGA